MAVKVEEGVLEAGAENPPLVVDFASGLLVKRELSLGFGAPIGGNAGNAAVVGKRGGFGARLGAFVPLVV